MYLHTNFPQFWHVVLTVLLTLGCQLHLAIATEESSVSESKLREDSVKLQHFTSSTSEGQSELENDVLPTIPSTDTGSNANETLPLALQKIERADSESENDGESDSDEEGELELEPPPSSSRPPSPAPTRPQALIIKSHPILTSSSMSVSSTGPANSNQNKPKPYRKKQPDQIMSPTSSPSPPTIDATTMGTVKSPILMTHQKTEELMYNSNSKIQNQNQNAHLKSQLDDLFTKLNSFPTIGIIPSAPSLHTPIKSSDGMLQNLQTIKDAYFDVLERLRDFRNNVSKRFEMVEKEIRETTKMLNETIISASAHRQELQSSTASKDLENTSIQMQNVNLKMNEMERRFNISRWVDYSVHYILSNNIMEAALTWAKLEMITAPNVQETTEYLRDIVHLVYARNNSNSSPIFPFLRKIHGVEKLPLYDFLINGMKTQDDFDGTEIFYIAQYLKERNAVRSSIYSKIPKAVQYAVSGRNVNFVFNDKRTGRHYLHVRDDQIRRDRLNFYIQASQSYTDSRAAVWTVMYEPISDTFRIRNSLYGDYMYVNEEGFVETIPANMATTSGMDFNLIWRKNSVVIQSKSYENNPLVGVRGGGKFPYYFSLLRENQHSPVAEFLVEPDTLLE